MALLARSQNCKNWLLASSCLSICLRGKTRLPLNGFSLNLVFRYFSKICPENHFSLKSNKDSSNFMWWPIYIKPHICFPLYSNTSGRYRSRCSSVPYRGRMRLKCDGTRAETRFRLSAKRTSPFKSAEASVQSTTGSRGVRISGNNAGYTMFRGSVKSSGYPLHSPVPPSLSLLCVTVCHPISNGLYILTWLVYLNPYPTAFPYGNGMLLHFYQQQESSTTKTVHKVINKGLKAYV